MINASSRWVVGFLFAFAVQFNPTSVSATTFCNMDESGGDRAKDAQRKSAAAAASFFRGAALTFEMFANLESHLVEGDKKVLRQAADLARKSREQLGTAARQFKAIGGAPESIRAIEDALKKLNPTDFAEAFKRAAYVADSPIGKQVTVEFEKTGAAGVMQACANSVEELLSKERPMGEVMVEVEGERVPTPDRLWAAIAQWNEVLIRGRVISAIFKISGKYSR